jgi:hypothetical protein
VERHFRIVSSTAELPVSAALLARYDREKLFEEVWSSVSDTALAKTCKKLGIPKPGVGGWQKLKARVPRTSEAAIA